MSKEITIPVPDGKRAEWINGVLTLVDEPKVDNRPVTERIKTFEDAREALGDEHPLVKEYWGVVNVDLDITQDLIAYLKLRIICAALNEGWEPQFTEEERRWYPWFHLYTAKELLRKSEDWKTSHALKMLCPHHPSGYDGLAYAYSSYAPSNSDTSFGSRLCLKSEALATYCGTQFIDVWADFIFKPRTGEELNGKSEAAKTTIDFNNNEDE